MQVSIYSNGSQECERAASLLKAVHLDEVVVYEKGKHFTDCLLYTSPSPRDPKTSRMPSSA